MAQPSNDYLNMSKIQFYSYSYHFFFAAAKMCILPFLGIYLRSLGLTASQIGIITGVGAWLSSFSATCWTSCANYCNKRRFLLIGSTLALLICYSSLMIVPPINDQAALDYCNDSVSHGPVSLQSENTTISGLEPSSLPISTLLATTLQTTLPASMTTGTTTLSRPSNGSLSKQASTSTTTTTTTSTTTTTTTSTTTTTTTMMPASVKSSTKDVFENQEGNGDADNVLNILTDEDIGLLKTVGISYDDLKHMTQEEIEDLIKGVLASMTDNTDDESEDTESTAEKPAKSGKHRARRDESLTTNNTNSNDENGQTLMTNMWMKITLLQKQLKALRNELFAIVLAIFIMAALFGSPAEKLSDDTWFDFLDSAEMLEKYGQHKSWATLGTMTLPLTATIIITHSPCLIFGWMPSMKIIFIMYGGLMFFCLLLSICYPIYTDTQKVHRKLSLLRGFRILFTDCHGVVYTCMMILLGMLEALLINFLFWHIQDLGGSTLVMGSAISVAALSQLFMFIVQKWLMRALSYAGAMCLGLLVLGSRLLLYSFIWSPWLVLIGEAFHGMSTTLLWAAATNYPDYRLNPHVMDRSALTVMNGLYMGLGVATGSVLSGYMLEMFGLRRVFQGACVVIIAWVIIFIFTVRFVKKKAKVRYAKLLQDDNSESDESVSFDENDWLEIALKHQK